MRRYLYLALLTTLWPQIAVVVTPCLAADWSEARFDTQVAPILVTRCFDCHSGAEPKGGLDLSQRERVLGGGESGASVVPGKLDQSLIWKRIAEDEMPPEDPLPDSERTLIRDWITGGAIWGTSPIDPYRNSTSNRAGYDWWSLQPLSRPTVPEVPGGRNAIDGFVRARLHQTGLEPSPQASPGTIIRRLSFDLLGLPPAPEDVRQFESAMRENPGTALEQLVKRLLDSRHFGERWGRHWLDVVRFGESQGFERDKLRTTSWHYRDWVIKAMNDDMPYEQFVRLQIAGDVLYPDDPEAIIATGFLVAGPWDEVGQSQQSAAMRAVVRQDEIEDYVGTIGQTFLGLTVNCARCHDHKFDPIRQKEYYQLASALGGVAHGERVVISNHDRHRLQEIDDRVRQLQHQVAQLDSTVRNRLYREAGGDDRPLPPCVPPIARWDFELDLNDQIGQAHAVQYAEAKIADGQLVLDAASGYAATHPQNFELREKTIEAWVRLDTLDQQGGAAISVTKLDGSLFDAVVYAERQPLRWMAGSDRFRRTKPFGGSPESMASGELIHLAIAYHSDGMIAGYRNGTLYGNAYQSSGPAAFPSGQWQVQFGLRVGPPDAKRQLRAGLETAQLYDRALTADEVKASFDCELVGIDAKSIMAALTDSERNRREMLSNRIRSLGEQRVKHEPRTVYSVVPRTAETSYVLLRGNPASPGQVVSPAGLAAIPGVQAKFGLAHDSADADRRRKLAEWITDPRNPLLARVIVNRLWHYHFGVGLVETPNDFGFNGGRPSHPELIDWLATELVESGWSLKHIHRLIVLSATYLQSSRYRADCAAVDAGNRLLWRKNPMRLEAEALRDAVLSVSGQLNTQYLGPPYRDFETFNFNSQFYNMIDPNGPEFYRRTVYRTWIRSGRNHLLDTFDCPDPSTTVPKRAVTTTPIQSLALMNNSFVLRMSDRFAERVTAEEGPDVTARIERVFQLAYGRAPNEADVVLAREFITVHGLSAFCRVVFNSNEFIHVD